VHTVFLETEKGICIDDANPCESEQSLSELLAPLNRALLQLVIRRKRLAERVLGAFREAQQQVHEEGASLPYLFQHTDTIPELRYDPQSDPRGTIEERVVTMTFALWDKRSWVLHHQGRYSKGTIECARRATHAYSDERNMHFVEFHGPTQDLLWIGDLVDHNLFRILQPYVPTQDAKSTQRQDAARELGFPYGCHTSRSGLLDTGDRWFAENAADRELVLEPESLYRGIVFGAALALLIVANGLEVNELVQVSADSWVEQRATPEMADDLLDFGTGERAHLQALLPLAAHSAEERRLYEICTDGGVLLEEIKSLLEQAHGEVPVVHPYSGIKQSKYLGPERYLFQWHAHLERRTGILRPFDLTLLVRFVLHGLKTPEGELIHITSEQLREISCLPELQHVLDLKRLRDELLAPLTGDLTPSTLISYRQHLLQYLRFSGTMAQAYQPETLKRWIAHLVQLQQGKAYDPEAIDSKVTPVRRCMKEACRFQRLDQARAEAFAQIKIDR
jgi:hypothetical protein